MVKKKNQTGQLKGMIHTAQWCFALQKSGRKEKKKWRQSPVLKSTNRNFILSK